MFSEKAREATLAMERARGFVIVVVYEPNTAANSVPAISETTIPNLALIRLHGRNHETWNTKGAAAASERFDYDHNEEELGVLASQTLEVSKTVVRTHVGIQRQFRRPGTAQYPLAYANSRKKRSCGLVKKQTRMIPFHLGLYREGFKKRGSESATAIVPRRFDRQKNPEAASPGIRSTTPIYAAIENRSG
jgi:hypothetical protein